MYAKGFSKEIIETAALRLGMDADIEEQPGRIKFTVRNLRSSNSYASLSPDPVGGKHRLIRTVVCFHGHYALFKKMFELQGNPDATISTSRYGAVTYTPDTLREKAQEFGMRRLGNPGNAYFEWQRRDCCYCTLNDPNPEGIY